MKNLKDRLSVLHTEDDAAFEDLSFYAFDFLKDTFTVSDFVYIGFTKPLNCLYFRLGTADEAALASTWSWEYYNGDWVELSVHDDTKSLARDGFTQWTRPDDELEVEVNATTQYWYRLSHSLSQDAELYGIGALFCDASDLKGEYAYIEQNAFYSDTANPTHIAAMVAAKDRMLDELKVSAWDIFQHSDTKKAATFLALSIIFSNASSGPDDKYASLASTYESKYKLAKAGLLLQIDLDDDGAVLGDELKAATSKRWSL